MKNSNATNKQKGFFDLGLSLAVLALSGTLAYAATPNQEDRTAQQDSQVEVVADVERGHPRTL